MNRKRKTVHFDVARNVKEEEEDINNEIVKKVQRKVII